MSLIITENICKSWTEKPVLRNVCCTLSPDERVGLVGPNGEGKTTLLRILAGQEEPTEGRVQYAQGLRIAYLPQDPPALEGSSLWQAMVDAFADVQALEKELHELSDRMHQSDDQEKLLERYGQLQHELESRGGYDFTRRIETVLSGLNFPRDLWHHPLAKLSGGQRTRACLAKLLLNEPNVLLLDEPTNHLDMEAVEWLEGWLLEFHGAVVVVSHDRYFLDRTTTRTWEIASAHLECYRGCYSQYVVQREERFKERTRRWEAQQQYIDETQDFIRRFIAGQRSKEAQGRRTRLERFLKTEAIEKPTAHPRISLRLPPAERTGDFVLRIENLQAGYEPQRPLVRIEKLDVMRGDRIAIVGPNGCGKTTLLRTILGGLPPLAGQAKLGSNVRTGYLSQTHAELSPSATALESVRQADPGLTEEQARNLLGSLLLCGDDCFKLIGELSGGQRSRVVLARLMLQKANVLVLDEPTNHLDIYSQEALQDVLAQFSGTVLFVSHDRYLIRELAGQIWAIHEGGLTAMEGNWDKYLQWRSAREGTPETSSPHADQVRQERKEDFAQRRKVANEIQRMQRRLAEVETAIQKLEAELRTLNEEISRAGEAGQIDRITDMGNRYTAADEQLRKLFHEWETLSLGLEEAGAE